jgi:hypothetical protein
METKTKEYIAAIVGAIIMAVIIGVWHFAWNHPKWPEISEDSEVSHRQHLARDIQNGLIWNAHINENRRNRAVRVLMDSEVNDTVVFLWNGVVKHNVYGYVFEIVFVDRTTRVWSMVYEEAGQSETTKASRSVLLNSEEISRQEHWGEFHLKTILCEGSDLTESDVSDVNRVEPAHLLLPKKLYNDIVSGKGKILLLDKDGTTLDSLGITVVDSK